MTTLTRVAAVNGESMPKVDAAERISSVLRGAGREAGDRVEIASLLEAFGPRGFGALLLFFDMPNLVPFLPGNSAVFATPLLLVAAQLAIGRRAVWLPRIVTRLSVRKAHYDRVLTYVLPHLSRIEAWLAPRHALLVGAVGKRLIGIACVVLAATLFLPIPLVTLLPAASISLFGFGLMEHDGLAAAAGWGLAVASLALFSALSGVVWVAVSVLFS
jgi:hypothetical protein